MDPAFIAAAFQIKSRYQLITLVVQRISFTAIMFQPVSFNMRIATPRYQINHCTHIFTICFHYLEFPGDFRCCLYLLMSICRPCLIFPMCYFNISFLQIYFSFRVQFWCLCYSIQEASLLSTDMTISKGRLQLYSKYDSWTKYYLYVPRKR